MMKRILLIFSLLVLGAASLQAQDIEAAAPVDSTLLGRSILSIMGPGITVSQSTTVQQALDNYIRTNGNKSITGYRIRVYYDNGPQARARSEMIERMLQQQLGVAVYRTFESPNYKVSVGDFRTKDEALRIYNALKGAYPTAYMIKETINYPR